MLPPGRLGLAGRRLAVNREKIGPEDHVIGRDLPSAVEILNDKIVEYLKLRSSLGHDVSLAHLGMAEAIGRHRELHWHRGPERLLRVVVFGMDAAVGTEHIAVDVGVEHLGQKLVDEDPLVSPPHQLARMF